MRLRVPGAVESLSLWVIEPEKLRGTGMREPPGRCAFPFGREDLDVDSASSPLVLDSNMAESSTSPSIRAGEASRWRFSRILPSTRSDGRRPMRNPASSSSLLSIWASLSRCIQLFSSSSVCLPIGRPFWPEAFLPDFAPGPYPLVRRALLEGDLYKSTTLSGSLALLMSLDLERRV